MIDMQNKKLIDGYPYIRYKSVEPELSTMIGRSAGFFHLMDGRRSVRAFSPSTFPREVLENILRTASTAPSGAHKQPWTFCIVSNPEMKRKIREAAEAEERESYEKRMSDEWLEDLRPLGTNWHKPFLETAPYLVVVFSRSYEFMPDGSKKQNYYVKESTGLACGLLLAAIHQAGLAALTHTPSPMNFLARLLDRPENEKPFLLIPVGFAAEDCWVPDISRKPLDEISTWYT
jgi:iodotyrosine deiodinase